MGTSSPRSRKCNHFESAPVSEALRVVGCPDRMCPLPETANQGKSTGPRAVGSSSPAHVHQMDTTSPVPKLLCCYCWGDGLDTSPLRPLPVRSTALGVEKGLLLKEQHHADVRTQWVSLGQLLSPSGWLLASSQHPKAARCTC